jgi:hypothetical protein
MVFKIIYGYFLLFHLRLFLAIVNSFGYCIFLCYCKLFQFKLLVTIINYFWLLKAISPYVIIDNSRLL